MIHLGHIPDTLAIHVKSTYPINSFQYIHNTLGGQGGAAAVPAARAAGGGGGRGEGSGAGAGTGGVAWRVQQPPKPPVLPRRFQYILAYIITSEYIPQRCSIHPAKSQYI